MKLNTLFLTTLLLSLGIVPYTTPLWAEEAPKTTLSAETPPAESVDKQYIIHTVQLKYIHDHADNPPLASLMNIPFTLGKRDSDYIAPEEGTPSIQTTFADISSLSPPDLFSSSAILHMGRVIVDHLNSLHFLGINVFVDSNEIDKAGKDVRKADDYNITLLINLIPVGEVTVVDMNQAADIDKDNQPAFLLQIAQSSPIQPGDLIHQGKLNDYVFSLNRSPSKKVNVQLTSSEQGNLAKLSYLLQKKRPIHLYANLSNTGTTSSRRWVERFGAIIYRPITSDDIFSAEYVTTDFRIVHSVQGLYEIATRSTSDIRFKAKAGWSEFTSSEFNIPNTSFKGSQNQLSLEITKTLLQRHDFFFDAFVKGTLQHLFVDNTVLGSSRKTKNNLFLAVLGIRFEQKRPRSTLYGEVYIEQNVSSLAKTKREDLTLLGRETIADRWKTVTATLVASTYLGRLSHHELAFRGSGTDAFNYRLIPQIQGAIGGVHTVRGYPQAIAVGDTTWFGQAEYKYHFPWKQPNWRGQAILFFDGGKALITRPLSFETSKTLVGTGVGLKIDYKTYAQIHADWGVALKNIPADHISNGYHTVNLSLTLIY
ncbi:ShlB/FhaC/HecB family hemolysin secretion/activation protein [Simkania negevensis]|uniref:ShlB/FhaC/HecB family hemolysin secretion/activation protein n=1 Tax=Simkania negevensis TaxID=83561 RepID=A0ABS3AQW0_9BACT|nr:ShlB/FhaC/HecB family hemolysin secretion/activation protein [Simkania negevensis]